MNEVTLEAATRGSIPARVAAAIAASAFATLCRPGIPSFTGQVSSPATSRSKRAKPSSKVTFLARKCALWSIAKVETNTSGRAALTSSPTLSALGQSAETTSVPPSRSPTPNSTNASTISSIPP